MNFKHLTETLDKIRVFLSEAVNPTYDVHCALFDRLDALVDLVMIRNQCGQDDAADFVIQVADTLADRGLLPPFPSDESNEAEIARWVNASTHINFDKELIKACDLAWAEKTYG